MCVVYAVATHAATRAFMWTFIGLSMGSCDLLYLNNFSILIRPKDVMLCILKFTFVHLHPSTFSKIILKACTLVHSQIDSNEIDNMNFPSSL